MINLNCETFMLFLALAVNAVEEKKPHEMFNQIHPNVIIQYMTLRSDMGEMLALYKLYWKHVEGGIIQQKFKHYCNILLNAFNDLFDLYFSDVDKFNEAKTVLIHLHNDKYPDDRVDELVWNAESTFEIHVQSAFIQELYSSEEPEMNRPHAIIRRFHPLALIEYMKSQDDMEELLILYYLFWRHKHGNIQSGTDGLEEYCYLLSNAFDILFDMYYSGTKDIANAIPVLKNIENKMLTKKHNQSKKITTDVVNIFLQFCYTAGV